MESQRLRILMLGQPLITWDGVPVKIARQQIRLILFYLAMQWKPVHRSTICQIFWPEKEDVSARKLLREALSKLRASLPDPSVLITQLGDISLDPKKVYVDGLEFKKITDPILESADFKRDVVLPGWLYAEMRKALTLCRGEFNLEGMSNTLPSGFEDFLSISSQAYDYIRLRIEERLASHCIAVGDLEEAIMWLSRTREIDPMSDDNNFLLVNCLIDHGRPKDALEFIAYLQNLYAHSAGQEIPGSILKLRTRILENHGEVEIDQSEWPGIEAHPVPFVGRANLMERLRNALNRKGIVSIRGVSGIGKNRLLEEFYQNLQRKPRLLFCSGKPMVKCSPFEPIIEGLRAAVRPEEWLELSTTHRAILHDLFPDLIDVNPNPEEPRNDTEGKDDFLLTCEALHQLLIILARKKPLLWVIDIILWCDDATIDFLAYLGDRDFYKKYGLLILCSRKEESNRKVEIFTDRYLVKGLIEQIEVPPLTKDEATLLIHKMTSFDVQQEFIDKFYLETGGNPYFIVEGLKSLLSLKFDFKNYSSTSLYPIPDTIKALISEKTHALTPNAMRILQAASVLGQFFMPEVVEATEELPTTEIISALEELERTSIISIRENPETGTGYFFDHDQIREVILTEMSPLRKRHLHLKAVKALIKVYGNRLEFASRYAYHYEEAGEFTEAFQSWLQAAEFARTRYSTSDRYTAYDRAARLVTKLPPETLVDNVHLLVNSWGNLAYDLSDVPTCEKVYDLCLKIGEEIQNPLLLGVGWSGKGRTLGMQWNIDEGIEAIRHAQFYIDRTNYLGEKLELAARMGILLTRKNDLAGAIAVFESALVHLPKIQSNLENDAMINILSQLGLLYIESGWPQKTIEVGDQAVKLSLLVKRRSANMQAVFTLASGYYFTGNYQKALQNAKAVYQLVINLNMRWWQSMLDVLLARIYLAMGDMDACWNHFQLAYDREKPFQHEAVFQMACSIGGQLYRLYGDLKAAQKMLRLGMSKDPRHFGEFESEIYFCLSLIDGGNWKESRERLERLIELAENLHLTVVKLPGRMVLLGLKASMGDQTALSEMQAVIREIADRKYQISTFYGMGLQAEAEFNLGNRDSAIAIYRSMLSEEMEMQYVWTRITACSGLYRLLELPEEKRAVKTELIKSLSLIGEKSTMPTLRRLYLVYRKKILRSL